MYERISRRGYCGFLNGIDGTTRRNSGYMLRAFLEGERLEPNGNRSGSKTQPTVKV